MFKSSWLDYRDSPTQPIQSFMGVVMISFELINVACYDWVGINSRSLCMYQISFWFYYFNTPDHCRRMGWGKDNGGDDDFSMITTIEPENKKNIPLDWIILAIYFVGHSSHAYIQSLNEC